jgi:hypothetical protein
MDRVPKDGSYLYFENDPVFDEWFWYATRVFKNGVWEPVAMWRRRFGDKHTPDFKPTGFRRVSEGLPK